MPSYKLTYFNGRGRAEAIRLIFAASGTKYEDHRIEGADWGALKPKTPFGGLPLLTIDGKKCVGQSLAIGRFVARETGLAGKTSLDQALVDSVIDTVNDISDLGMKAFVEKDAGKKAEIEKDFKGRVVPAALTNLEKFLGENSGGNGFFVGSSLTWADLYFYAVLERYEGENLLDGYPKLAALYTRVKDQPKVKDYIKSRLNTPF